MKVSSILSIAIALFSIYVVASPVGSTADLVARDDSAGADIITTLTTGRSDLDVVHQKYTTTVCQTTCTQADITAWQLEIAIILRRLISIICGTHVGFVFSNPSPLVSILCDIIYAIQLTLSILLGRCSSLIATIITLALALVLGDLVPALLQLLSCLQVFCVANLITLITTLLGTLLNAVTCLLLCPLLGIPL